MGRLGSWEGQHREHLWGRDLEAPAMSAEAGGWILEEMKDLFPEAERVRGNVDEDSLLRGPSAAFPHWPL